MITQVSKKEEAQFKKWAEEFGQKLPENLRNSWTAVVDNDYEGREELKNAWLRQQDYTTKTQELAKEREAVEAEKAAFAQKEQAYQTWYSQANQEYMTQNQKLKQLENALGQTGFVQGQPKSETTPEQKELLGVIAGLHNRIEQIDRGTYNAAVNLSSLAYKAAREGYAFDPAKVVEISTTQNLPLDRAFNEFIAPEREARQKAQLEKEREELREQIKREILSNRPGPDNFGSESPVTERLFATNTAPVSKYDRVNDAVKEFYANYKGD